jgi:CheY-like chemotaxis protein
MTRNSPARSKFQVLCYVSVLVNDALAVDTVAEQADAVLLELRMRGKNGFEISDAINRASETKRIRHRDVRFFRKEFDGSDFAASKGGL